MRIFLGSLVLVLGSSACGDDLPDAIQDPLSSSTGCDSSGTESGCIGSVPAPPTTSSSTEPSTTESPMPETSSSSGNGPETPGVADECDLSTDCDPGEFCVAPFTPEWGPEGKGPNECVTECVVIMDELRWCLDATACCDSDAVCTDRGYCEHPEGGGASSGGTDTDATGSGG